MNDLREKYSRIMPLQPGKNAKVFRAVQKLLRRHVFLKIYPIPADDPQSGLFEPQILTKLEHKNLVKIYNVEMLDSGELLLEMQLIKGGSLNDLLGNIQATGIFPSIKAVLGIVRDVTMGINILHSNKYVHRDIKPANIMLRKSGANYEAVVTDLGLVSKMDAQGNARGSKHAFLYRPPEVWNGGAYTKASDIYQIGLVLYQLLGGDFDYTLGSKKEEVIRKAIVSGKVVNIETVGVHVDNRLKALLRKLICPEKRRIKNCNALLAEIQKILGEHRDWCLSSKGTGSILVSIDNKVGTKVEISSSNKQHLVQVYTRCRNGSWRRKGDEIVFHHKELGQCRDFRRIIDR